MSSSLFNNLIEEMVNISDFFKKEDKPEQDKKPSEEAVKQAKPQEPTKPESLIEKPPQIIPMEEIKKEFISQQESVSSPAKKTSSIVKENIEVLDEQKTKALYDECLKLMEEILNKAEKNEILDTAKIKEKINTLTDQVILGNYDFARLINTSTQENYLYAHSVNVCILSVLVGIGLGYEKTRLYDLSIAAFLHDIGMVKVRDISEKPTTLTDDEYKKLQEHPLFSTEILSLSKDMPKTVIHVAEQHHEFINGRGYPKGLKGDQINEYAKIVSAVDSYEALTHPRSHRERHGPYYALKTLLEKKENFDYRILKVLIQQMGVYPIGSYIQLSSGEVGTVVKTNRQSILRPIIKVDLDSQGKRLKEEKIIDLAKSPTLYIKKSIKEEDLNL